jgi:hypothetical protein
MAISENPKRKATKDEKAEQFIAAAGKQTGEEKLGRKPVMLRIKPSLLKRIDKGAERLGSTRTGFILTATAEKLEEMGE